MSPMRGLIYEADEPVPPGATLDEWLKRSRVTQADLARRTDLTAKHINQVVKGNVGISAEVAIALERVTEIPARYWAQLESNYQTAKRRIEEREELAEHEDLLDLFPVRELERRGYLERGRTKVERLAELLRFFGVGNVQALKEIWISPALYRRSPAFEADEAALAVWLRMAELDAHSIDAKPFDAAACREALEPMRALSRMSGVEWVMPLTELCASVGIALVILKELPKCRVNGATRWLSPVKVLVVLSLRHRRNDIFWFTLFHELCHVLRHSKKETFIDRKESGIDQELEDEADAFAAKTLIPPRHARELPTLKTADDVVDFAQRVGVAPGIVVGRMQHQGLIPYSQWTRTLIDHYRFKDE